MSTNNKQKEKELKDNKENKSRVQLKKWNAVGIIDIYIFQI